MSSYYRPHLIIWYRFQRKPSEGQLSKWTNLMKGWQFRWFTLDPHSGLLEYYVVRTSYHIFYANSELN